MAEAVVTKAARKKMVKARAGDIVLPKIVGMAFGCGGVSSDGSVLEPSPEQTALNQELMRKEVDGHEYLNDTTCRYTCTLGYADLAGEDISELGLYDAEGDLVAVKNFSAKGKDADIEMTFNVDDTF